MKSSTPSYRRHRFPREIVSHAVWLYHRFCLSFRDVEDLLAERGVSVTYETRASRLSFPSPIVGRVAGSAQSKLASERANPMATEMIGFGNVAVFIIVIMI